MIEHLTPQSAEILIRKTLTADSTKCVFINKSNFLFILDSVIAINDKNEENALFKKAAYLLTKTVELHSLADGNKRAAALLTTVFLSCNDRRIDCQQDEFYEILLGIAKGGLKENNIREWLQKVVRRK